VLDAGHGGDDPGAIGPNGTKEKDINLKIVNELKELFENDGGYRVILTRTDDTFIPLAERTQIANDQKADLFVSVHCNASINKNMGGFEVYFLNENASDPEAAATAILENSVVRLEEKPSGNKAKLQQLLWSMVVNEFINESSELCCMVGSQVVKRTKLQNRGVKQAGFYVLRGTQMPAILVETAFLSHAGEEAKLNQTKFKKQMADAIYNGVKNYAHRRQQLLTKKAK
jgi:N-acetylmuramoyl-L-alanine amidase